MQKDNYVYIKHMLDLARETAGKIEGKTRLQFDEDKNLSLALTHLVQMIAETAKRVSREFREKHSHIAWDKTTEMYNKISIDYRNMDEELLWFTVTNKLLPLIEQLEKSARQSENEPVAITSEKTRLLALQIAVSRSQVAEFCRKHHICKFSFFGSGADSDVDVLVEFDPEHVPSFFRLYRIEQELSQMLGNREVDIVSEKCLIRHLRQRVLESAEVQYEKR